MTLGPDSALAGIAPVRLLGSNISYFTGKLENYFRLRGIPYELHPLRGPADAALMKREVGVMQIPAMQLADNRWMTDTTKIIQWFERELPGGILDLEIEFYPWNRHVRWGIATLILLVRSRMAV